MWLMAARTDVSADRGPRWMDGAGLGLAYCVHGFGELGDRDWLDDGVQDGRDSH